ncbi:MAG: endonuclease/exonuclease/phosphatase family protein [Spirochaetes bacterium]|nr:endonuclease/exonuclease/phosphatase family protein [Spirochaetota bacterium]MBU1080003.1 endonuclease/exonuclease/phosphatase family protein [Spirochaetota bacterium]
MGEEIRIATFNAENFFMLLDKDYSGEEFEALSDSDYAAMNASIYNPNKDRGKVAAIADIIMKEDFDVVGLCEIGGVETLANFTRYYLSGRYDYYLHQENSRRGIFVGALVKKGRFDEVEAGNVRVDFSRNLLELRLASGRLEFSAFVVHLKSQHGQDRGIEKRLEEIEGLRSLVAGRRACVVLGDFNGIAIRGHSQFEFDRFLELPLRDVLEAVGVPEGARFTHFYFAAGKPSFAQLDYIFCSDDIAILGGGAMADMVPLNFAQRRRLPSDHVFLKATIAPPERDQT